MSKQFNTSETQIPRRSTIDTYISFFFLRLFFSDRDMFDDHENVNLITTKNIEK